MLTLNNLITEIESYSANHNQIKSWYFNSPWDELNGGESIKYPMLFGVLQPNSVSKTSETTSIRFYISDKVKKGKRNELDVFSDCKLIALDTITYFKQMAFTKFINVQSDFTLTDFTAAFNDEICGWYFDVNFTSIFELDLCGIPVTQNTESSYIIDQAGTTVATLAAGSYYSIEILQAVIDTITSNVTNIVYPIAVPIVIRPTVLNAYNSYIVDQNSNIIATLTPGSYYSIEILQAVIDTINSNTTKITDPV